MDTSPAKWLSEMGMEEPAVIHQCQMNSLNHSVHEIISLSSETYSTTSYPYFYPKSTPFQTSQMASSMIAKPEAKQLKPNDWNSHKNNEKFKPLNPKAFFSSSSSSKFVSFANSNAAPPDCSKQLHGNVNCTLKSKAKSNTNMKFSFILSQNSNENPLEFGGVETQRVCTTNTTTTRTPLQAQDHVVAERKRREKLSQRFIALSALVPGLKKMDPQFSMIANDLAKSLRSAIQDVLISPPAE